MIQRKPGGIVIERAGPLHATVLAMIHARAFDADVSWDERIMAGQLSQPGVFGLMEQRGGMILTRAAADEAEVLTVAVVPERRQQGLGAALVREAAEEARRRGVRRLFLEVSTRNPAARGLYSSLGFTQVGRRPQVLYEWRRCARHVAGSASGYLRPSV